MRKGERTRQQIIEITAPLFNTRGYEGTSLSDLCKATGLTKGALYGNFGSKEELSLAVFQYTIDKMRFRGREYVDIKETYKEKLIAYLEFYSRHVLNTPVKGGCPILNTAVEADDFRLSMKNVVTNELEQNFAFLANLLEQGKKAGEFREDIKSRETAMFFFCAIEGAIMASRVASSDEAMKNVVKNLENIIVDFCS